MALAESAGAVASTGSVDFSFKKDTPSLASEYASGSRGSSSSTSAETASTAITESATSSAQKAVETGAQEVGVLATAIPSCTDIASGIQEAKQAQIQAQLRPNVDQLE